MRQQLYDKPAMEMRLLFWAFLKPVLNGVIGVILLMINYFGLKLMAGALGIDLDKIIASLWIYLALISIIVSFILRKKFIDATLNMMTSVIGLNFSLGLIMTPYLAYIFWPTLGWKYLVFWLIAIASVIINVLTTPVK